MYEVTLFESEALPVLALAHRGPYAEIGTSFERLMAFAGVCGLMGPQTRSFGLYYDDPASVAPSALRSEACVTAPASWTPDQAPAGATLPDANRLTVRGGRYAKVLHVGPYAELEQVYDFLYRTWLPTSGEEPDDAPCVEEYLNAPQQVAPKDLRTEVWLPLKPR